MSTSKDKATASSNWLALQKTLDSGKRKSSSNLNKSRKRRKVEDEDEDGSSSRVSLSMDRSTAGHTSGAEGKTTGRQLRAALQNMVLGHTEFSEAQNLPGKYLALDCEMVGVGIDGAESSLARVSLVNFYGAVILDEYVRQKERVVDYRTQWSGIRESDMVQAKSFEEVQKKVADLIQDNVLIGHAVYNDLKALLLSHPRSITRDTQYYAHKFGLCKTNRVALRNLVKQELDMTIQAGEHSSVTDARATMAVYRIHKKEWEKGSRPPAPAKIPATTPTPTIATSSKSKQKRKRADNNAADSDSDSNSGTDANSNMEASPPTKLSKTKKTKAKPNQKIPGGGKKGISSGLSTIIHRVKGAGKREKGMKGDAGTMTKEATEWWKQLPGAGGGAGGSKGSIKIGVKR